MNNGPIDGKRWHMSASPFVCYSRTQGIMGQHRAFFRASCRLREVRRYAPDTQIYEWDGKSWRPVEVLAGRRAQPPETVYSVISRLRAQDVRFVRPWLLGYVSGVKHPRKEQYAPNQYDAETRAAFKAGRSAGVMDYGVYARNTDGGELGDAVRKIRKEAAKEWRTRKRKRVRSPQSK